MNEEMMTMESNEMVEPAEMPCDTSDTAFEDERDSGLAKIGLMLVSAAVAGAATFTIIKKDTIAAKLEERKIKRWEKKGYKVIKLEEPVDVEAEEIEGDDDIPEEK